MTIADVLAGRQDWHIEDCDVREGLARIPDCSVHCVVTSPPYWGLRAYGTEPQVWGGSPNCPHSWGAEVLGDSRGGSGTPNGRNGRGEGYARSEPKGAF